MIAKDFAITHNPNGSRAINEDCRRIGSMKFNLPDKVADIQSISVNFERGTFGTEQRGVYGSSIRSCSEEFCN